MPKPRRARLIALAALLAHRRPEIPLAAIRGGRVLVDGRVLTNPAARVRVDASLRVTAERRLRGDLKLSHALDTFDVAVADRVAADVGASAGGFTTALLAHGARRVYAVDAGVGQLLGALRLDERVINLEGTNLASLGAGLVPEPVELISIDLSYLALAAAIPQLESLAIASDADLLALVKPTFELHRGHLAASPEDLTEATALAAAAAETTGWNIVATCLAPPTGQHGAIEAFLHGRRAR